jgi:PAS domain S-box-containing protein
VSSSFPRAAAAVCPVRPAPEAEDALRRAEERLRAILDTALDCIITTDRDGRVIELNQAAERVFGYGQEEAAGRSIAELIIPVRYREAHNRGMARYLATGEGRILEKRIEISALRADDTEFPVELAVAGFQIDGQQFFTARIRDITERRRAEEALARARLHAETASHAKSTFLAHMSHELRTPLNAVIGFAEALQYGVAGGISDKQREYVGHILASGQHLLAMVNDILDLCKVEAGKLELEEEPVEVAAAMNTSLLLLQERMREKAISVESEIDPALPRLFVDRVRLQQILLNVVSNAVKFTPRGGTISIAARSDEAGDIVLAIRDTGPGMSREEIATALQPFLQVRNPMARTHEGTGLGLPLTKSLMELHDGSLDIDSTIEAGTTVTLRFPKHRALPA